MEELIKLAIKYLEEGTLSELELFDGQNRVRVVKGSPPIWYQHSSGYQPIGWQYWYQY